MRMKISVMAMLCFGFTVINSLPLQAASQASRTSLAFAEPSDPGPFRVSDFSRGLSDRDYASAQIYYPQGSDLRGLPATTLSGGLTNSKEQMSWLAKRLASHGIIAIVFTPTNKFSGSPLTWEKGHKAAFRTLIEQNRSRASAIFQMIDESRIAMMGYSLGGAGSILAAEESSYLVRAVVGICPYNPIVSSNNIAHLFITGTRDTVASPARILRSFRAMREVKTRAFAKFKDLDHLDPINFGGKHDIMARYIISWLKVYLAGDEAYEGYLSGDQLEDHLSDRRVFADPSDYIFVSGS